MSAPAVALPSSVQRENEAAGQQQDIAKLAYAIWQKRGSPIGSGEEDWIEAEKQLRGRGSVQQPQATPTRR